MISHRLVQRLRTISPGGAWSVWLVTLAVVLTIAAVIQRNNGFEFGAVLVWVWVARHVHNRARWNERSSDPPETM